MQFLEDMAHDYTSTDEEEGEGGAGAGAFPWRMPGPEAEADVPGVDESVAAHSVKGGLTATAQALDTSDEEGAAAWQEAVAETCVDIAPAEDAYITVARRGCSPLAGESGSEDSGPETPDSGGRQRLPSVDQSSFSFGYDEATTNTAC